MMAKEGLTAIGHKPQLLRPGQTCPHCGMARLVPTPDQGVSCPLCGLRTGAPST